MYGKFFASTFTGSMYGAGPDVFAVWGYVIANAADSQVELNPLLLAAAIGTSPERIAQAINILCSPDPRSRSKGHEGRRLLREGEYAYHVPNFLSYRAIRNEDDRRTYNREKQREHRERVKASVIDSQSLSTLSAHAETETETEAETEAYPTQHTRVLQFDDPSHATAYMTARSAARNPVSFDAMLGTLYAPITGGTAYPWPVLGQAILELHANGSTITANAIRAFCRKLAQPESSGLGRKGGATGDGIDWTKPLPPEKP